MLATLERKLRLGLALCALQSQNDLLGCLGLLVENRLGLTTVPGLFAIVTALSLGEQRGLRNCVSAHTLRLPFNDDRTLPALYCVTLCCVCFLHVLPLQ
jgi:hypothetical protein